MTLEPPGSQEAIDRKSGVRTREALAAALKAELARTPLDKVSVRRLTEATGITRQAFYYHFSGVADLAVWMFKAEISDRVMAHATYEEWSDGFLELLLWLERHKEQTYLSLAALSHEELERFLHRQFRAMTVAILAEFEAAAELAPAECAFIIDHFSLLPLGHLLHWLATDMDADPYILVERIERISHGALARSIEEFSP